MSAPDPLLLTPTIYPYVQYDNGAVSYTIWIDSLSIPDKDIGQPDDQIARWISDGRYIYNRIGTYTGRRSNAVQIVARTGEIQNVEVPYLDFFLTGTPEGWLAFSLTNGAALILYTYDGDVLQREEIATFERQSIKLLKKPRLGYTLDNPTPFPEKRLGGALG